MTLVTVSSPAADIVNVANTDLDALENLCSEFVEKVSIIDKKDQSLTVHVLNVFITLAEKSMTVSQPYLISNIPAILNAIGDKKSTAETRSAAELACKTICSKISPNAVKEVLPFLFQGLDISCKWQTRVAALNAIASFADHAPEQLGFALPDVIPEVSKCVVELKKEVCEAAEKAMVAVCDVVGNR